MDHDLTRAAEKWDVIYQEQRGGGAGQNWWEAGSTINAHINRKISGSPEIDWQMYTLQTHFKDRLPLARCLSLGCGTGNLERKLGHLGAFVQCDAYDVSQRAVALAQADAEQEGLHNIRYQALDVNALALEADTFDAIWLNGAMHHFQALEHICAEMKKALKADGLLILFEYVGPNRFQFPERQKEAADLCLHLLPERYRKVVLAPATGTADHASAKPAAAHYLRKVFDKLRDGDLLGAVRRRLQLRRAARAGQPLYKTSVQFPSARDVIADDPSEAIRSQDILQVLQHNFEIVEKRDWGGNIVQFALFGIAGNFSDEDEDSQALLRMLFNIEETLIQCGEFDSDFCYIVARPKAG